MSPTRELSIGELATALFDGPFGSNLKTDDYTDRGVQVVRLENIGHRRFISEKQTFISTEKAAGLARHRLSPDDVLFSSFVDDQVRVCLLPHGLPSPAINKADCFCIRVDPRIALPEFVALRLASPDTFAELRDMVHGATRPRIGLSALRRYRITVPPLPEQRRIVARIEALFARTRRARADLERIAPLSGAYTEAMLARAFEGSLTEGWCNGEPHPTVEGDNLGPYNLPDGWAWRALPSLGSIGRGKSRHRPRNDRTLYGGPYPFIQTGDVRSARGRLRKFAQTYSEAGLAQSKLWPRDTVCITIAANIAETAILDIEACFPDSVVGFRSKPTICLPEYIEYFFRVAKKDLAAFAPATAQKNINLEILEAVLVPTPSLPEQRECTRVIARAEAVADRCVNEATSTLALLDRLERSILARAFRGELVPQEASTSNEAPPATNSTARRQTARQPAVTDPA